MSAAHARRRLRARLTWIPALAVALATAGPAPAGERAGDVVTVASYPNGAFLENLAVVSEGGVLVTSYVDRRLLRWDGHDAPDTLATLPAHPVGIVVTPSRIVLSAHGASFLSGPAFASTNRMLVLDRDGVVQRDVPVPDARFLNGMVALSEDVVLVADSIAGRLWRFEPTTGRVTSWLDDPLLTPQADSARPGANGLKLRDGWLYVSNSSRGALYRVRVEAGRASGALETVATAGPIDDFAFLDDGSVAAATHGDTLIRIAGDGRADTLMASGCDGCTSVAVHAPTRSLIVLTTGGLVEGGKAPARILRLPLPDATKPPTVTSPTLETAP